MNKLYTQEDLDWAIQEALSEYRKSILSRIWEMDIRRRLLSKLKHEADVLRGIMRNFHVSIPIKK